MSFLTLKAKMRTMPGMEAMRMSQRHPMVGITTEARPMMSREPASQNTWGDGRPSPPLQRAPHCLSQEPPHPDFYPQKTVRGKRVFD